MRGNRIPYSPAEMRWLEENRMMVISDYHRAFRAAFDRPDVTAAHLHSLRKRKNWKIGTRVGRTKGRRLKFSENEIAWLRDNRTMVIGDYHAGFCATFERTDISESALLSMRKREGWKTGRTGQFNKGGTPWSKGKKLPYNANRATTQFKKGEQAGRARALYKPIGFERVTDGYLVRKINDDLPRQSRWRAVHLLNWEKENGPLPAGDCLKCLDGNKLNTDPSNWKLVPRGVLPRLNGVSGRGYDNAPAELKPTIMAVALLEQQVFTKSRRRREA